MENQNKDLVLSLIHNDLISRKLIFNLRRAGLNADIYYTDLSTTIFTLMQIPNDNETIYETYATLTEQTEYIDIEHGNHPLKPLAHHIYNYLAEQQKEE